MKSTRSEKAVSTGGTGRTVQQGNSSSVNGVMRGDGTVSVGGAVSADDTVSPGGTVQAAGGATAVSSPSGAAKADNTLSTAGGVSKAPSQKSEKGVGGSGFLGCFSGGKCFGMSMGRMVVYVCLAVFVVVCGVSAYTYFSEPWSVPMDVRVTNVSSRSATISWVTEEPTRGFVIYGTEERFKPGVFSTIGRSMAVDDRDVSRAVLQAAEKERSNISDNVDGGIDYAAISEKVVLNQVGRYYVHHVTIANLDPGGTYYYMVGNGYRFDSVDDVLAADQFSIADGHSFTTFPETDMLLVPNPAYGGVRALDAAVTDGILYMVVYYDSGEEISVPLSATLNESGNWYIDLSSARTIDGEVLDDLQETEDFEMVYVQGGDFGESEIMVFRMDNDAPMPTIELLDTDDDSIDDVDSKNNELVSYIRAEEQSQFSECVDSSKCPKMSEQNKDNNCCGCNYVDTEGDKVEVSCGFMEYCCDNKEIIPAKEDQEDEDHSQDTDISPADKKAIGASCHSIKGVLGECGWVPDGCEGGHFVNNACPGSERVKCCIPEAQLRPNEDDTKRLCEEPNAPDYCFAGKDCGDGGKCQLDAYEKTSCTVDGKEGRYKSNLCGGGIEVRCCQPVKQETTGDEEVEDEKRDNGTELADCPYGHYCNSLELSNCGDDRFICMGSVANKKARTCCCMEQDSNCFDDDDSSNDTEVAVTPEQGVCLVDLLSMKGKKSIVTCTTAKIGTLHPEDSTYVCKKNDRNYCRWIETDAEDIPDTAEVACITHLLKSYKDTIKCSYSKINTAHPNSNKYICVDEDGICVWKEADDGDSNNKILPVACLKRFPDSFLKNKSCEPGKVGTYFLNDDGSYDKRYTCIDVDGYCTWVFNPNLQVIDKVHDVDFSFSMVESGLSSPVLADEMTYIVNDEGLFVPEEDGVYSITIDGLGVVENVRMLSGREYTFFIDENQNGYRDEDEIEIDLSALTVEVTVDSEKKVFTMDIVPGLNYVSFDHLPSESDSCSLIKEMNGPGEFMRVTALARFDSAGFQVTTYRADMGEEVHGDCFPVVPGRGYVVRSYVSKSAVLDGYPLAKPAQVELRSPGWYLVGINGATKTYTALSLIKSIETAGGLDVDNVSRWDLDRSRYDGLVEELDNQGTSQVYGFDFPIETRVGYFVRVIEGGGIWTPE